MVTEKREDIVSSSNPVKMNGEESGVACERRDEENAIKEVTNEENAKLERKNGKIAMEEEKNEETASVEEENNEGKKMEEDKKNESNAIEDEDSDQDATEEDYYDEDEDEEDGEEEEQQQVEEEVKGREKEENTVEQEEKLGANSKEKVDRSRKRNKKKKVEEVEEEKEEEKGEGNEENTKEQENEKVGINSGEKVIRPRKRKRKNSMVGSGTLTSKKDDGLGSLAKQKTFKRVEGMGMIFMCNSKTKKDCYRYNVLGLPASKREIVEKIYKGMRLFLFDFDLKLMYGIYKAAGPGGYNIEPNAFKSAFPSQVRFTVMEDCLPLAEEKFKTVIKENYYGKNKFNCQLTSKQVKELCKLFASSSRGSKPKKISRNARAEPRIVRAEPRMARAEPRIARAELRTRGHRGRIRRRSRDGGRRSSALGVDRRRLDTRPTTYDREMHGLWDRDEERRSPLVGSHQHRDHPMMYERELEPLHRLPPLPLPTAGAPAYASYGRTLEVDAYGRDLVVERHDPRLLDLDLRHRDEIVSRDSYISYREIPPYRDTLYSSTVLAPPEYYPSVEPRVEYRLAAPPPLEYRRPEAAISDYDRLRRPEAATSDYDRLRPLYRY